MRTYLRGILQSFSVQLLLLHLRSNFLLLFVWLILVAIIGGWLGPRLGLQYLFLDPEYLNTSGFWSFLLVGSAFGFFTMSWNLSTYLLIGGYFNFLASLSRPFFKFCINNALLPLAVFFFYCGQVISFYGRGTEWWRLGESLSGLVLGLILSLFTYALYFNLTNRDISYYRPRYRERPPNMGPGDIGRETPGRRSYRARALAPILIGTYDNPYQVENYLDLKLKTRLVRSVAHYDSAILQGIFRQNHLNAILVQFIAILALFALGLLIDQPLFQVPAGGSFLVLLTLLVAIIGAISYWFSEWRFTLLVLLLFGVNLLTSTPWIQLGNQAYGLDYGTVKATYSQEKLLGLYGSKLVKEDIAATLAILENWKARQTEEKPPFVITCASGGGLTAALWAVHVTQSLEQCSNNTFLSRTALLTGASGGMMGLGYLREAYYSDPDFRANATIRLDRISRDLLNPIAFSMVSNDLFLPLTEVKVGGKKYRRDRAYGFEREFSINTDFVLDKPLWEYREPERRAEIPLLFITPSIVDDGRRLVISPQGVSYMTAPPIATEGTLPLLPDMVDFRWLLKEQDADSIRFGTALRMNATYPYVLPLVRLPTSPTIRVMDAGYRDNYGIASAIRFLSVFREWIAANTSGVHLVQISAFREGEDNTEQMDRRGIVESLLSPVGVAGNILGVQILDQEGSLGQLATQLGPEFFHLYRFNFQPAAEGLQASVSLHLTDQERQQVLRALDGRKVQREIDRLLEGMK